MAGAAETVYQGQVPEWTGAADVLVEHLYAQLIQLLSKTDRHRVASTGSVRFDANVGWPVAHQRHQAEHSDAAYYSDIGKGLIPPQGID